MYSTCKKETGRARAPNPWPTPSRENCVPGKKPNYCEGNKSKPVRIGDQRYNQKKIEKCYPENYKTKEKTFYATKPTGSDISYRLKEDRKASESYYGAYAYGKKQNPIREIVLDDDTPSPRGLTRDKEAIQQSFRRAIMHNRNGNELKSERQSLTPAQRNMITSVSKSINNNLFSETMQIESRRTIVGECGIQLEEISIIKFPKNLPSNVQVILSNSQLASGNN